MVISGRPQGVAGQPQGVVPTTNHNIIVGDGPCAVPLKWRNLHYFISATSTICPPRCADK